MLLPVAKNATEKMRTYRQNLRQRGMKLLQIWVPDPAAPGYAEAMQRQCELLNQHNRGGSDTDWIENIGAFDDSDEEE
jgi:Protein  of unknown function (DUF3018)